MLLETVMFWLFAILGIAGGIGLLFNKSPVYAALSLILNFFSIAGLYLSLHAEFLAVIQILVYAGAIMVLFLFVIMLLNLEDEPNVTKLELARGFSFLLGLAFVGEMIYIFRNLNASPLPDNFSYGQVETVGASMMSDFVFPFEMISVILIAALMAAIVIAKRHNYEKE